MYFIWSKMSENNSHILLEYYFLGACLLQAYLV